MDRGTFGEPENPEQPENPQPLQNLQSPQKPVGSWRLAVSCETPNLKPQTLISNFQQQITNNKIHKEVLAMSDENKDMLVDIERYRVKEGSTVNLKKCPTGCDVKIDKSKVKSVLFPAAIEQMKELQEKLYAQNTYGLIIVLQAMDAAGKDGTVNHVFANLDPGGVKVVSFKQPSSEEKDHDYMWRINKALPERGDIGIFNRSQYEDVIVTRIHDLIHQGQLPKDLISKNIWEERYEQIRHWEKYLYQNGFPMIKIFLHVSKEEQQKRLMDRIFNQQKNWKFSMSDIHERQYWDQYQSLYEEILSQTSKDYAPWYVVPADNKWYTRYVVALITLQALKKINPQFPKLAPDVQQQLDHFKKLISAVDVRSLAEIQEVMKR